MSKILILEPFYTNFHIDLSYYLSNDVYSLVFNIGNLLYLQGAKNCLVHRPILKASFCVHDLELARKTKSLYTESLRKLENKEPLESDFEYMAKYISYLRKFILENNIDLLLMHNDLRWQHALAIEVCRELSIRYLVSERGLFRPDTTTIDSLGVNAYSSIPKAADFYRSLPFSRSTLKGYKPSKYTNTKINLKFALFLLVSELGAILRLNTPLKNKDYKIKKYFTLFARQKFKSGNTLLDNLPKKYIFIPLQVNTDTQLLIHSEFKSMQAFINHVENTFYAMDNDIKLVFKVHPMENSELYFFDERSFVTNIETNMLIRNCELVVTINSTVGFEAIQAYKKVIVLGDAFYKINEIVVCSSPLSFRNDLIKCLNDELQIDKVLISKFICYLRSEYQVNGNLFNYDSETFNSIKRLLLKGN